MQQPSGLRRLLAALLLGSGLSVAPTQAAPAPGSDEAAVLEAAGLRPRDGAYYREGCATAFRPETERLDINRDGRDEIALLLNPSGCFGESLGGNVALYMLDATGRWAEVLAYAPGVELLPSGGSNLGFIDIGVASPGGCMGVFRWNGSAYAHAQSRAIEPGGCQFR